MNPENALRVKDFGTTAVVMKKLRKLFILSLSCLEKFILQGIDKTDEYAEKLTREGL